MPKIAAVFWTLAAGAAGAFALAALGVPAGALIGSSLAVAVLGALTGLGQVPERLRDLGFIVIGVSLGSGIDTSFGAHVVDWALSLTLLSLSLAVTLALGAWILMRGFGMDRQTAVLASSPGTMSNAIALAVEGKGDVAAIMALQVLRLLVLVLLVPPLAAVLDSAPVTVPKAQVAQLPVLLGLLLASYGAGWLGQRAKVPAACLLAGLILSATAHGTGLVHGAVPSWAIFAGFAVTGATLGTRMTKVGVKSLAKAMRAGAALLCVTMGVSFGFALITAFVSGLPLPQVWIAFAPGGVEAMAAIGLSLGYDPAFVALHHFVRIVVLVALVPVALGRRR